MMEIRSPEMCLNISKVFQISLCPYLFEITAHVLKKSQEEFADDIINDNFFCL